MSDRCGAIIVVGSGYNGVACACYLAKVGLRALVLEQYHTFGGPAAGRRHDQGRARGTSRGRGGRDAAWEAAFAEAYEAEITVAEVVDGLGEPDAGIQRGQVATNRRQATKPWPSTERLAGTGPFRVERPLNPRE